jgi:hypothetical protein
VQCVDRSCLLKQLTWLAGIPGTEACSLELMRIKRRVYSCRTL